MNDMGRAGDHEGTPRPYTEGIHIWSGRTLVVARASALDDVL